MKILLAGVAVVSGVFFGQSLAHADAPKWQQFCEHADAAADTMPDLNSRMKQLGDQGWELTGVNANVACFKRAWGKGTPAIAIVPPPELVKIASAAPAPVVAPARVALVAAAKPAPAAAPAPMPAAKVASKPEPAPVKPVAIAKPAIKPELVAAVDSEPAPAIAAAAAEIMASPSVAQVPAPKPSQAQAEPPTRSLLQDAGEPNTESHPRRALVPKS